jgi:hypothetical protein
MDDEIDIQLRSASEVARRAIVVAALLQRMALEDLAGRNDVDGAGENFDLREWIVVERLTDALTASEARLLESPLGSIARADRLDHSWHSEALAALLWSIARCALPAPGLPSELPALLDEVPQPWDRVSNWVERAQLRSESDIARERELAELWYWRLGAEIERRHAPESDRPAYEQAIHEVVTEAAAAGYPADALRGDFVVSGRPVSDLGSEQLNELAAIAEERLRALNWVSGFGTSWDDVPLDV